MERQQQECRIDPALKGQLRDRWNGLIQADILGVWWYRDGKKQSKYEIYLDSTGNLHFMEAGVHGCVNECLLEIESRWIRGNLVADTRDIGTIRLQYDAGKIHAYRQLYTEDREFSFIASKEPYIEGVDDDGHEEYGMTKLSVDGQSEQNYGFFNWFLHCCYQEPPKPSQTYAELHQAPPRSCPPTVVPRSCNFPSCVFFTSPSVEEISG